MEVWIFANTDPDHRPPVDVLTLSAIFGPSERTNPLNVGLVKVPMYVAADKPGTDTTA